MFVHLRVRSEMSIGSSLVRLDELPVRVRELGMPAVALTDRWTLAGVVRFGRACAVAGVKPTVGAEVDVRSDGGSVFPLVLICRDQVGLRNLVRLLSQSWIDAGNGSPVVALDVLSESREGLVAFSGAKAAVEPSAAVFGRDFYVELARGSGAGPSARERPLLVAARRRGTRVIATADVRCPDRDDVGFLHAPGRGGRRGWSHLAGPEEMEARFADLPEALAATAEVAASVADDVLAGAWQVRLAAQPLGGPPSSLREATSSGLERRLVRASAGMARSPHEYRTRLADEVERLTGAGLDASLLALADCARWARENGIPVGPGRGALAGTLVAWTLGLSQVDPLRHGLVFERFEHAPSLAFDFGRGGAARVRQALVDRLGPDRVMSPTTFAVWQPAPAAREARRRRRGGQLALRLQGLVREAGPGTIGVLASEEPVAAALPVWRPDGGPLSLQFGSGELARIGLPPLQFLEMGALDVLAGIEDGRVGERLDLDSIPERDIPTADLLARGDTEDVFLLDANSPLHETVTRVRPEGILDLASSIALSQPGSVQAGWDKEFIERSSGPRFLHPALEPTLAETRGMVLFQEQVILAAESLAGMTRADGERLRRALARRDARKVEQLRVAFLSGCIERGLSARDAETCFEALAVAAAGAFLKAHALPYALIAWRMAWVKAHHRDLFQKAVTMTDEPAIRSAPPAD